MTTPSPYRGSFRWAWHRAVEYRAGFWVGAVAFSALVSGVGAAIVLPANPTLVQKVTAAGVALASATILTVVGSYACALAAAPYQQRNELRRLLATSEASLTKLESAPATPEHAARLREIAKELRDSLKSSRALSYGSDAAVWRPAFHEHFPDVRAGLEAAAGAHAAYRSFWQRLTSEFGRREMDAGPWNWRHCQGCLAGMVAGRSVSGSLGDAFEFNWRLVKTHNGELNQHILPPGERETVHIFAVRDVAEVAQLKKEFEAMFREAETWPEAAAIGPAYERRTAMVEQATVARLGEIANMDPITSRCKLCRGPAGAS